MSAPFWQTDAAGITLRVKVQPRARRPGIKGVVPAVDGTRLGIAVTEVAEDGRANRAVCATMAQALKVPESAVAIAQGAASREKLLRIAGDPALLAARLAEIGA